MGEFMKDETILAIPLVDLVVGIERRYETILITYLALFPNEVFEITKNYTPQVNVEACKCWEKVLNQKMVIQNSEKPSDAATEIIFKENPEIITKGFWALNYHHDNFIKPMEQIIKNLIGMQLIRKFLDFTQFV